MIQPTAEGCFLINENPWLTWLEIGKKVIAWFCSEFFFSRKYKSNFGRRQSKIFKLKSSLHPKEVERWADSFSKCETNSSTTIKVWLEKTLRPALDKAKWFEKISSAKRGRAPLSDPYCKKCNQWHFEDYKDYSINPDKHSPVSYVNIQLWRFIVARLHKLCTWARYNYHLK